ncbi:unnamed protein product [Pleuronectes platessa]|uniref:Uncharacterized protein n=1 Tax=Pleuronectes platessa TaxID=8262 RepID=A0A9N7YQK7_PLEPL|nr:unnamed protein product [Pleuronectes platessa]
MRCFNAPGGEPQRRVPGYPPGEPRRSAGTETGRHQQGGRGGGTSREGGGATQDGSRSGPLRWLTAKLAPLLNISGSPRRTIHRTRTRKPRRRAISAVPTKVPTLADTQTEVHLLAERAREVRCCDAGRGAPGKQADLNASVMGEIAAPVTLHSTDINRSSQDTQRQPRASQTEPVRHGAGVGRPPPSRPPPHPRSGRRDTHPHAGKELMRGALGVHRGRRGALSRRCSWLRAAIQCERAADDSRAIEGGTVSLGTAEHRATDRAEQQQEEGGETSMTRSSFNRMIVSGAASIWGELSRGVDCLRIGTATSSQQGGDRADVLRTCNFRHTPRRPAAMTPRKTHSASVMRSVGV